jgi:hypothetical protein
MRGEKLEADSVEDGWRDNAAVAARGWLAWIFGDHLRDLMGSNPLPLLGGEDDITAPEPMGEVGEIVHD